MWGYEKVSNWKPVRSHLIENTREEEKTGFIENNIIPRYPNLNYIICIISISRLFRSPLSIQYRAMQFGLFYSEHCSLRTMESKSCPGSKGFFFLFFSFPPSFPPSFLPSFLPPSLPSFLPSFLSFFLFIKFIGMTLVNNII